MHQLSAITRFADTGEANLVQVKRDTTVVTSYHREEIVEMHIWTDPRGSGTYERSLQEVLPRQGLNYYRHRDGAEHGAAMVLQARHQASLPALYPFVPNTPEETDSTHGL